MGAAASVLRAALLIAIYYPFGYGHCRCEIYLPAQVT